MIGKLSCVFQAQETERVHSDDLFDFFQICLVLFEQAGGNGQPGFSLFSLLCFMAYDEKSVTAFIARHRKEGAEK